MKEIGSQEKIKTEIIVKCLKSLVASANLLHNDVEIAIIDDHSDQSCLDAIEDALSGSKHPHTIIHAQEHGNRASLKAVYEYARDYAREMVYFVEDDYLHMPHALSEMVDVYPVFKKNLNKEVALYTVDYPDRYTPEGIYESMVVLGNRCHWRTTRHSTFTFFTSRSVVFHHWNVFEKTWQGEGNFVDESMTINQLWQNEVQLFSPIPTLAVHMQFEEHKPPFVDWKKYWDAIE